MKECRKRQVERRGDRTEYRCMNRRADTYRQMVDEVTCDACPVRVYLEANEPKATPTSLPVVDTSGWPSCEFRHRGPACGVTGLSVTETICRRCTKDEKMSQAKLFDKVVNYSKAVRKWVAAGKPERSDERVQEIFDKFCSNCHMFDKKRQICNSCGCPSNTDQPAIRNKLKMATETCPLGQWE